MKPIAILFVAKKDRFKDRRCDPQGYVQRNRHQAGLQLRCINCSVKKKGSSTPQSEINFNKPLKLDV